MKSTKKPNVPNVSHIIEKDTDTNDASQLLEEYKMLREEMMSKTSQQDVDMTFSVTTVIAILSYSLASKERYVIFAALLVTLMMLYKTISLRASITKISAYIIVYLEPKLNVKWETVNYEMYQMHSQVRKKKRKYSGKYLIWIIQSLAASIIYFEMFLRSVKSFDQARLIIETLLLSIVVVLCIWTIVVTSKLSEFDMMRANRVEEYYKYKSLKSRNK